MESVLGFTLLILFFKVPGTVVPWEVGTRARDSRVLSGTVTSGAWSEV